MVFLSCATLPLASYFFPNRTNVKLQLIPSLHGPSCAEEVRTKISCQESAMTTVSISLLGLQAQTLLA